MNYYNGSKLRWTAFFSLDVLMFLQMVKLLEKYLKKPKGPLDGGEPGLKSPYLMALICFQIDLVYSSKNKLGRRSISDNRYQGS